MREFLLFFTEFKLSVISWCCGRVKSPNDEIQEIEKKLNETPQKTKNKGEATVSATTRNTQNSTKCLLAPNKASNNPDSGKKKFPWYFMLSNRSGNSNSRPSYASGEFFTAYLCRNSWKGILLGKPFRQIRIPSSTPLHLSWCKTRLDSITPAFLCSLGTMQRTKWGQVLYRVSISRVSCSLMKIWTQLGCKTRTCVSTMKTPTGTCAFALRVHQPSGVTP